MKREDAFYYKYFRDSHCRDDDFWTAMFRWLRHTERLVSCAIDELTKICGFRADTSTTRFAPQALFTDSL